MTEESRQLAQLRRWVQICVILTGLNTLVLLGFMIGVFQAQVKLQEINERIQQIETRVTTTIELTRDSLGTLRQRFRERWLSPTPEPTPDPSQTTLE